MWQRQTTLDLQLLHKNPEQQQKRQRRRQRDRTAVSADSGSVMKILVVLVLLSGCHANILWQEPPRNNLDMVSEAFWEYVAKATQTAAETLEQIRTSELGQEVNTKISQSTDTVNQYVVALQTRAAPVTQDFVTQFTQEAERLKARLEQELTDAGEKAQPYAQELVSNLQRQVEELRREATPYAEALDPEALKAVLLQKSQELKGQLDSGLKTLSQDMRSRMELSMEEFQISLMPLAQNFQKQLSQKSQELQNLAPHGEELKEQLDADVNKLKEQLSALWDAFTKKSQ